MAAISFSAEGDRAGKSGRSGGLGGQEAKGSGSRSRALWVRFQNSSVIKAKARVNAPRIAHVLFLLKVVAEVIDPVMGSSQLGRIERQIRTFEATNIRAMNLLLVIYPFIGRLQAGDGARETVEKIVRWNYGLGIIFLHDSICLRARED